MNRFYRLMLALILALSGLGSSMPKATEQKSALETPIEVCNCGCGMANCCCGKAIPPSTTHQNSSSSSSSQTPTTQASLVSHWGMPSKGLFAKWLSQVAREPRPWGGLFPSSMGGHELARVAKLLGRSGFISLPLKAPGCCLERLKRLHIFRI